MPDDPAVRVDRALGAAGGAARVEDARRVVLVDRDVRERRVGVVVLERREAALHLDHRDARLAAGQALEPPAVADQDALDIMHQLRTLLPGYLVPRLVRESPGAGYKVPLEISTLDFNGLA